MYLGCMEQASELVVSAGRLVRQLRRATGTDDVPASTLRLLAQVEELAPVTIGALARADRCAQPTMSAAVHRLVDRGWVSRRPHPDDARASLVELTPAGTEVLATARARMADLVADRLRAYPDLDERDLGTAVTVLRALLADSPSQEGTV